MGSRNMPNVYSLDDVELTKINIKTPVRFPNAYTCFELFYDDTFMLYKLSNLLVIYQEPTTIKLRDVSSKMKTSSQLQEIFDSIIKRIKHHSDYSQLISSKRRYPTIIDNCFKIININEDTVVFDSCSEIIPYTRLKSTDAVSVILYIKSLWVNDTSYGFILRLCQIKRTEPYGIKMELGVTKSLFNGIKIPPPPPPPPLAIRIKNSSLDSNTNPVMTQEKIIPIMRPSLHDIISSKQKLKKVV